MRKLLNKKIYLNQKLKEIISQNFKENTKVYREMIHKLKRKK